LQQAGPVTETVSINSIDGYSEQMAAFAELLDLWGANVVLAENTDPCRVAEVSGLRCLSRLGSLRDVAHLNRPIILNLTTETKSSWFVMTDIDDNVLTLSANGQEYAVDRNEVLSTWSGFFTLLWRAPPAYQQPVKRGDRGAAVDWLMTQLALVEGTRPPSITENRMFDADLETRIKRFQISVGLVPDGIVGDQTWIHLNNSDSSDLPTLHQRNKAAG
jgi:general secretion pathway protein A